MNKEEKWLVAVTAGRWQRHGIREAKAAGLKILAIDTDPAAEGFADADKTLVTAFDNHAAVIDIIQKFNLPMCGAVSFCSEVGMMLAASIREAFHLPGPGTELSKKLLDKAVQRKIWAEKNVPGPQWKMYEDVPSALTALREKKLPVIIKPTDSSGSRGVTKIESHNDDLTDAVKQAFEFSRSNKVIIESYMDGTEFTVEVFVINKKVHVLAVTEKKKVEGTRGTVARELATPDRSEAIIVKIKEAVISAFTALDYTEGPGHAEIILMQDNSVGLVEVAGRGGGFMVFDKFVPAVSGINIARLTALQAIGEPVTIDDYKVNAAVLRFFPSIPGELLAVSGFDKANQLEGVEAASFVEVGAKFHRATTDGDRLGFILSKAATPARARELADEAEQLIAYDIKKAE